MRRTRVYLITLALFILFVAGILSNFASSHPDGLERVAANLGFLDTAQNHPSLLSDYMIPGITNVALSTGLAGILGSIMVFLIIYGLGKVITLPKENH